MTAPGSRYAEPGCGWWPLAWGPGFAIAGAAVETVTPGTRHPWAWVLLAVALALAGAAWVYGRRRVYSVSLSSAALVLGRETLPVSRIAAMDGIEPPAGARVLGGGWAVPKGTTAVPLRLDDGSVVLAWARDPQALSAALRPLLGEV